jgi:hypothetical protein
VKLPGRVVTDDVRITDPLPCASRCGAAAFTVRHGPDTTTSTVSACLTTLSPLVWRRPSLRRSGTRSALPVAGLVTTGTILLALVLGLVFPRVNFLELFLLFFTNLLERSLLGRLAPTPG